MHKLIQHHFFLLKLKIWRNVDPETNVVHPGMVDHRALRVKLSKQLKIDLDEDEKIHILGTPVESHDLTEEEADEILTKIDSSTPCEVQLRQLGKFVAKISLSGGYSVPLKFLVLKR